MNKDKNQKPKEALLPSASDYSDLLACPFCGENIGFGRPWWLDEEERATVAHPNNGCILAHIGTTHYKKVDLVKLWNTRSG